MVLRIMRDSNCWLRFDDFFEVLWSTSRCWRTRSLDKIIVLESRRCSASNKRAVADAMHLARICRKIRVQKLTVRCDFQVLS